MEKIISKEDFIKKNKNIVFKEGSKQVLVIGIGDKVFALDNRCPHEGYPLSEGTTEGKACLLTCNWHNWKFDLKTGKCLVGGDNVRTYPVEVSETQIKIDLSPPSVEQLRDEIIEGFEDAFRDRQYGRISRELARLSYNKIDPLYAIKKSILWSFDRFEYGMTHAYAATADWLKLYFSFEKLEDKMICLTEAVDHIAFDSLRYPSYPFTKKSLPYCDEALLKAIEEEDRELAESLVYSRLKEVKSFEALEETFSRAALTHYNDFGHSLIYVTKCSEISKYLQDEEIDMALALSLVRSLCYATREDLIPEFKLYSETLEKLNSNEHSDQRNISSLNKGNVNKSYEWLTNHYHLYEIKDLFDFILRKNAQNFLEFDLKYQEATDNPVTKNVGWLDFTHGITFSNAVRVTCTKYPELWSSGILQMISFYGRNAAFTDDEIPVQDWKIQHPDRFKEETIDKILDHGIAGPIFSSHVLKTAVAIFEEAEHTSIETGEILWASLNRFLHSPLKQKHVRRLVSQGIKLVARDFE